MNPPLPSDILEKITQALLAGRKIEAIKICRTATGASLAEAKKEIDEIEVRLRASSPDKFDSPEVPAMIGCTWGISILLLGVMGGLMLWFSHSGDTQAVKRFTPLFTSMMCVMLTLQFCVQSLKRSRLLVAWACLAVIALLLISLYYRAVHS